MNWQQINRRSSFYVGWMRGMLVYNNSLSGLVGLEEWIPRRHLFKRDWTTCPQYDNNSI